MDQGINFIAVIVTVILNIILGALWYSNKVFGEAWAKEHRFSMNDLKPTPKHHLGAILVSLITVLAFAYLISWLHITTVADGLKLGFILWLGFIATTHFSGVIWAKKPLNAYFIDAGFQLVSMLMIGAILSAWH